MKEKPLELLQAHRDGLIEELHAVYNAAPSTTSTAYRAAQKALQKHEDMTFSDAEIDAFLPRELKRSYRASEALSREAGKGTATGT
jgi:vacuolar-type H+-ATPase subunit D/Vma8